MSLSVLQLRKATLADAEALFHWRNHPRVRDASLDQAAISWETHRDWFEASLQNPDRALLIGEWDAKPVGVLRFDWVNTQAVVSIYLVPEQMGQGHGTRLLKAGSDWLRKNHAELKVIHAEIRPENLPSVKTFEKAGYCFHSAATEKGILTYEYAL